MAYDNTGHMVVWTRYRTAKRDLPDYIGKEVARKLLESEGSER